jgi:hypothetical protein
MKTAIAQAALLFLFNVAAWSQCMTLMSIAVTPQTSNITTGSTQQFVATGTFTDGTITITTDLSPSVTWSSSNTLAATINSAGLATAVGTGGTTIQASRGGVTGSATLNSVVANFPGITYDMWIDFEHDTLGALVTAGELANSTHGAAGSWNTSQTGSHLTVVAAGEDPAHAITGDTGTRGLAYNLASSGQGWIQWNLPSDKHSLSFGLWYKTYQAPAWDEGPHFITLYNNAYGPMERFSDERSGVNNARQVRISPLDQAIPISDNTWYWFTMKWVQNGSGIARVYDTNLNLVGTVTFTDSINFPAQAILLGSSDAGPSRPGQAVYFDDLIIDYTNAAFPVLPKKIQ